VSTIARVYYDGIPQNPEVKWHKKAKEEIILPYYCPTDLIARMRRIVGRNLPFPLTESGIAKYSNYMSSIT
jgi:hypothetical protein